MAAPRAGPGRRRFLRLRDGHATAALYCADALRAVLSPIPSKDDADGSEAKFLRDRNEQRSAEGRWPLMGGGPTGQPCRPRGISTIMCDCAADEHAAALSSPDWLLDSTRTSRGGGRTGP